MRPVDFPCALVHAEERDLGYVIANWIETSRPHYVPISVWKKVLRESVLSAVQTGKAVVAHAPEDRDHLYGFAVAVSGQLQYVYVRNSRRRGGLGAALLADVQARTYAPGPKAGESWARRRGLEARKDATKGQTRDGDL